MNKGILFSEALAYWGGGELYYALQEQPEPFVFRPHSGPRTYKTTLHGKARVKRKNKTKAQRIARKRKK